MKLTNVNIKASGMNRAALAGWTKIAIWYQYNYSYIDITYDAKKVDIYLNNIIRKK